MVIWPGALEVGRAGFQPHDVGLLELQLGRVLAGDDAFVGVDESGEAIEEGRLARAGAAGDEHVAAHVADDLENLGAGRRDRAEAHELVEGQLVLPEFADREGDPVDRQRRRDDVDARAVEQARVADRRGLVDSAPDLADDALADVHQLRIVSEPNAGELDLAVHLDEAARRTVDHDVGDVVAGKQRLERPEAEHVVADVVEQILLLGDRQDQGLDRDDLVHDVADFVAGVIGVELGQGGEIDRLDQRAEYERLGLEVRVRPAVRLRRGPASPCAPASSDATPRSAGGTSAPGLARLPNMAKALFL